MPGSVRAALKPEAYKDVAEVVEVMEAPGVKRCIARLRPFATLAKGMKS